MHGRIVAALLLAGLVTAGQHQDAKVLSRASAVNPAPPKAAAAPDPTGTDPPPLVTAIPDEPTEDPKPEPAPPEQTPSQSSSSSKPSSSSSSSSPDPFSSPRTASTSAITTSTAPSSSSTSPPRGTGDSGPTPVAPNHGDDLTSSTSTTTTTTITVTTTDSSRTTSGPGATSKSTTRSTSSSTTPTQRVDESTSKPPATTTPKPSLSTKSPKPTSPTKTRTTGSSPHSSSSQHSSAPGHSTTESGTADQFNPAPTPSNSSSDVAGKADAPTTSNALSPQVGPADNTKSLPDSRSANSSLLHNKQATALVFTFSALVLLGLCGLVFWFCKRRRSRDRHIILDEKDDMVAFRRANSSASRSSRAAPHRPTSMVSVTSSGNTHESQGWHYLPARFAGIQPIRQPSTLDAAAGQIAQDPFAVHRVVYPDMPQPQTSTPQFTLFPDPVPPPPPRRTSYTPTRVPPPRPGSLSPEPAAPAASRPRSPESHYDEESVYTGIQRRPYMIERRPERRRVDE